MYTFMNDYWNVEIDGIEIGPLLGRQVLSLITAEIINCDTLICKKNEDTRKPASESVFASFTSQKAEASIA